MHQSVSLTWGQKAQAGFELMKARLSSLVIFSAVMTYLLADKGHVTDWWRVIALAVGGFMVTGGANIINQILEIDLDQLMKRTMSRPLPTGRIAPTQAGILSAFLISAGALIMAVYVNPLSAAISVLSAILYGFVYTPLKRVGPIAVAVGAIPGALPPLIGWAAATGDLSIQGWVLFGIQFIWQFPHFWAIAWILDDDYSRAGFRLLPYGGRKDMNTAFQIMIYTLFLIPMGLLPYQFGITGVNSAIVATVCGVLFLAMTFNLMREGTHQAARRILLGSVIYLPIVQIAYVLDRV